MMGRILILVGALAAVLALTSSAAAAPPTEFGTEGPGAGQFIVPRGIAANQETGDLYLADSVNSRVDQFDEDGNFIRTWGWGVSDGTTQAFQVCDAPGPCFAAVPGTGGGQFAEPQGVAVDNSAGATHGDVWVVDRFNRRIERFGPAGEFILTVGGEVNKTKVEEPGSTEAEQNVCPVDPGDVCQAGTPGPGPSQFEALGINSIAVGPTGTVYVGDIGRVHEFTPAGAPTGEISLPGAGLVGHIAVDSAGNLYALSTERQGVRKYNAAGAELGTPRDPGLVLGAEPSITVDPADQLIVSDPVKEHLFRYDAAGLQNGSFPQRESGHVQGGIALNDATKALYTLALGPSRVLVSTLPPPGPTIAAEQAAEVEPTTATLTAALNPQGAETTYRFRYGTTSSYGQETSPQTLPADFEDHKVSAPIAGLAPRTAYHFQLVAESECEPLEHPGHICVTAGADVEFTTLPPVSIDSTSVSNVSATAATLEAELNPHGLPSTYRFEYGLTTAYGQSTPTGSAGSGKVDVLRTAQLQGLQPTTTYHYRVVAENSLGEGLEASFGPDRTFTTQGAFASLLPDNRGWELVSPPDKHGVPLEGISGGGAIIQAAADGSGIAYAAFGSIGAGAPGNRSAEYSQLLSTRSPAVGWSTRDVTTAHREPAGVIPGLHTEYRIFSTDLSLGAVQPEGATPLSPQATEKTPYLLQPGGSYLPLVTAANAPEGTKFGGQEIGPEKFASGVDFVTATPGLSHVLLASPTALTSDFEPAFKSGRESIYEWSAGALRLVSQIPTGSAPTCGGTGPACFPASEAGQVSAVGNVGLQVRGAISADGSRVTFGSNGPVGSPSLYLRDLARSETVQLDAVAPGGTGESGGGLFQLASADGSRVFFTDDHRLTHDSTAQLNKPDLYMCEIAVDAEEHLACDLTDLTANTVEPNEPADLQGTVIGASADGSSLYFVANGALTEDEGAVAGNCPKNEGFTSQQSCNLYRYNVEAETTRLIAVLSGADFHDWIADNNKNLGYLAARTSPNGRYLAFMSQRPLTGYDNRDAKSGARDQEVFLFDTAPSTQALACASCNPTGARPRGVEGIESPGLLVDRLELWAHRWLAASIPGWTLWHGGSALYQSRYLSNSGRLFFNAADSLVPQDTNGTFDVYEFEFPQAPGQPASNTCTTASTTYSPTSGGCASLITSGTSPEESAFLDASESGDDVFFLTASKLAPTDEDSALDVYDARSGGSSTAPVKPVECAGDGCQQPALPPNDPTPGSLTFNGAGNVVQCPKGKVKQKGHCVKRKHKQAKHKKKGHKVRHERNKHHRAKQRSVRP